MDRPVTFRDLDATLRSFGFTMTETPEKNRLYRYPGRDDILVLLPHQALDAEAPPFSWGSVRSTLANFGFIDRDNFFEVVRNHGRVAS
jgi:hypothetical protein